MNHNSKQLSSTICRASIASTDVEKDEQTTTSTTDVLLDETACFNMKSTAEVLEQMRSKMSQFDMDAFLIPSDDPHLSEYTAMAYRRRAFVSKFTGSAGTALILKNDVVLPEEHENNHENKTEQKALLWTDSRYFNEAGMQLDAEHYKLMKSGWKDTPTIIKYLTNLAKAKQQKHNNNDENRTDEQLTPSLFRVGIDPFVHSASFCKELTEALEPVNGIIVTLDEVGQSTNIVDDIWSEDRPALPSSPFRVHPLKYAGVSVADKLAQIRGEMSKNGVSLSIFSALDDIAYLFNLRASDVDCCPVGISYGSVSIDGSATLYCEAESKLVDSEVLEHLKEGGVTVAPYDDLLGDIQEHLKFKSEEEETKKKIWLDTAHSNYAIARLIPKSNLYNKQNAVTPMKACKNEAEMEGMRRAHMVDGVAMAEFMSWLEDEITSKKRSISEVELDIVLCAARARQPGYIEPSFPTIAGVGPNGAIIHYRAKEGDDIMRYLNTEHPILIDSGGQYEYGTTDVTRTWHMGEGTPEFKEYYTRVLKGNIGVDSMIWPEDTPGFVLDVFARKALWEIGKDYGHGTGHGVGAALNVHEGPHGISPRFSNKEPLKAGMVVSNEPGYYEDGRFGIRIENLLEILPVNNKDDEVPPPGSKQFLRFEKLTLIPIQKNLILVDLLNVQEMDWLDSYHAMVWSKVGALMEDGSPGKEWLKKMCSPIERP